MNEGKRSCWPKVLDQVSHVCGTRGWRCLRLSLKQKGGGDECTSQSEGTMFVCPVFAVLFWSFSVETCHLHPYGDASLSAPPCLSVCDAPPAVSERAAVSPPLLLCPLGSVSGVHLWRLNFRTASPGAPLPYVLHSLPPRRGKPPPLLLLQPLPPDPGKPPPLTFPSRRVVFLVLLYYFTSPSCFTPIWSTTCSDYKWFALW